MNIQTAKSPFCLDHIEAVKRKHSLRNHTDSPKESSNTDFIVDGLLPQRQFGIFLGNSGLGKSPALYQLGMCAAASVPFLGDATTQSDVLYLDFENGSGESHILEERVAGFLGLQQSPANFLRWNGDDCSADFGKAGHGVEDIIRDWSTAVAETGRPKLVIVDPLRFWLTNVENAKFADQEVQRARALIRKTGATILGVHHLRRVSGETAGAIPALEVDPRSWILGMSRGAVALINGTDIRLGMDNVSCSLISDVSPLVIAGFRRVRGQVGPIYIERVVCNDDEDPLGYKRLASVELLGLGEHIDAFRKFPSRFTFTDAKQIFGKGSSATTNLLKKCIDLKLLSRDGKHYNKVAV